MRFARFWDIYPNKKGKDAAKKIFMNLDVTDELLSRMISAIKQQMHSPQWVQDNGRFIPFPETWLSRAQWEDEEAPLALSPQSDNPNVDPDNFDTDSFFKAALIRSYGYDPHAEG